jgi:hypothetical protein
MAGRFKAVLIGNNQFPQEPGLRTLRCPLNDVQGLSNILRSKTYGPDGPYDVLVLKNKSQDTILKSVYGTLAKAEQDEIVLIYYSGHGKLDRAGELYLASKDTTNDSLPASSVPIERIKCFSRLSPAKAVVWILDCCFSGAVGKFFKGDVGEQASEIIQRSFAEASGTYILTASTSLQLAEEKEGDKYSLFTKHLITGIRSAEADVDEDGYVSIQELFSYLRRQVPKEGQQEPRSWFLDTAGNLMIAKTGKPARQLKEEVSSKAQAVADAKARSLAEKLLSPRPYDAVIPQSEINEAIKAALPETRDQIFSQARAASTDRDTKHYETVLANAIAIFNALIASDENREQPEYHAELAYVLFFHKRPRDASGAEGAITEAIEIRNKLHKPGSKYYEFFRGRLRIETRGSSSDPAVAKSILADLKKAFRERVSWEQWVKEDTWVRMWLTKKRFDPDTLKEVTHVLESP